MPMTSMILLRLGLTIVVIAGVSGEGHVDMRINVADSVKEHFVKLGGLHL